MAHPEFRHIGNPLDRLIEECAELIKAAAKAKRFGFNAYNPYDTLKIKNIIKIVSEFKDVRTAYTDVLNLYNTEAE